MPTGGMTPDRLMTTIERGGVTHTMLVPSLLRQFVDDPARSSSECARSTLRWVVTGAEPVPRALIELINEELPDCTVCQGYGLSEFPTIATLLAPEEALAHHGSAGRAAQPYSGGGAGPTTGELPGNGPGELLIRSPGDDARLPQPTRADTSRRWRTAGCTPATSPRSTPTGFVSIVGRTKDMIISGALNVYPKEIEDVINRSARRARNCGRRCARRAIRRDAGGGHRPKPGAEVDVALVQAVCRDQLASYKRPRSVLVRDDRCRAIRPGKILKRVLRPWAAERARRRWTRRCAGP